MAYNMAQTVIKNPLWWHRRTAMERRLMLVQTVALLAAVALVATLVVLFARQQYHSGAAQTLPSQSAADGDHDVCLTPGCLHAASQVLNKLDPSLDPCDDFYQYACGNYLRTTNMPDDRVVVDTMSALRDQLMESLHNTIEEDDSEAVIPKHFQLARQLYRACTDKKQIESLGEEPLQRILKEDLGGWPAVDGDTWDEAGFDWLQSVHRFFRTGFSVHYLIKCIVYTDIQDSSHRSIYLDEPPLGLSPEFLVKGLSDKLVDAYYQYQVDIAVMLGAERERAQRELRESLEFEIALANITVPKGQRRRWIERYNPFTVDQLQHEYPSVSWLKYLQMLLSPHAAISSDEVVVVLAPSYLKGLEALLSSTPKRVMANYLMWRAAKDALPYMTLELRERRLVYQNALNGKREREFRWKDCLDIVTNNMDLSISSMYVRKFFNQESKEAVVEMVEDIRQELLRILQEVDWMDEVTRKKALDKAKSMVAHIAYPDELLDDDRLDRFYEQLNVSPAQYLESMLNVTKFIQNHFFSLLRQPINESKWMSYAMTAKVDASFDLAENSIEFPAGILQGAFFSADRPKYMNYGAIGFFIGYVMTRGFDDEGRLFDKDGNLVDWWDPATHEKYLQKARCVISQAENFTDEQTGMHLNGVNTQGYNSAANGAFKAAYRAYLKLEWRAGRTEQRLPSLSHLSSRQMFWVSAAQNWCSKYRTQRMRELITTDFHPPDRFRVLGPLSNRPEFAEDFGCPPGSRMNPVDKCEVW